MRGVEETAQRPQCPASTLRGATMWIVPRPEIPLTGVLRSAARGGQRCGHVRAAPTGVLRPAAPGGELWTRLAGPVTGTAELCPELSARATRSWRSARRWGAR